ncbi:MAG: ParA family protein [Gemmatimonadaceae bacterium]|nr:ParA family protein [Gemmatimonadaceae bacterium]
MTADQPLGRVLAVVSQKGGVGKTTTAVNLAAAFARRGLKTLIVDVDPQGAVRYGVGLRKGHATVGFADYLRGTVSLRDIILPTQLPWLRAMLVGSVNDAAEHDDYARRATETHQLAQLLRVARERCHVVVVDTPPGLGGIVRAVLGLSQHVIVPLQCEPLALQTTPQMLRGIQDALQSNDQLALEGVLLTMYQAGNPSSERTAQYIRQHLAPNLVYDIVVPRSMAPADAFAAGVPVVLRNPTDPAALAYLNLAGRLAEHFA